MTLPPVTTGLLACLRADAITGLSDNTTAPATWVDSSAAGNNGTRENAPTWRSGASAYATPLGGPSLKFSTAGSSSADRYVLPSTMFTGTTAAEVFVVMYVAATNTEHAGPYRFAGNDYTFVTFSDATIYDTAFTGTRYSYAAPGGFGGTWHVYNVSCGAGTWVSRVDGVDRSTHSASYMAPGYAYIGHSFNAGTGYDGLIAEVLLYNQVLSSTDRGLVYDYLVGRHIAASGTVTAAGTLTSTGAKTTAGTAAIACLGSAFTPRIAVGTGALTATGALTPVGKKTATGAAAITCLGSMISVVNDNFVDAVALTGSAGSGVANLTGTTREPGEPDDPTGSLDAESIWFSYTPTSPGTLVASIGAGYALDVYDGESLGELEYVTSAPVDVVVAEGTRYNLRIRPLATGTYGSVAYTWAFTARVPEFTLTVPDDEVDQTPATLRVSVTNGTPDATVTFSIDGTDVWVDVLDETGVLTDACIPLPALAADLYTLDVTDTHVSTSALFTVDADPFDAGDPYLGPLPPTLSTQVGVQHWVIQDPTGVMDDYTFAHNPAEMDSPHPTRTITLETTTASDGQVLSFEGGAKAVVWTFKGQLFDEATVRQLAYYPTSDRRWYLIDHRRRAWTLTFENFSAEPLIKPNLPWAHNYTMSCLIHAGPEQLS